MLCPKCKYYLFLCSEELCKADDNGKVYQYYYYYCYQCYYTTSSSKSLEEIREELKEDNFLYGTNLRNIF